uniref:Probable transcriptional regulatory protein ENL96_02265 n=1 Tax=candidate division CPR3 bacterium TaxID=2268181 RepID=A0A7C5URU1_UNCC3
MSGHSKWANIKRQKTATDAKRGQLFTKITRLIVIAAKNGGDPSTNPKLAFAIEKAKEVNMPKETIEKAIKKGTGEDKSGGNFEELVLEGVGKSGVGLLIECTTDNRNRTISEVKKVLERGGWTLGEEGAISWQFEPRGLVTLPVVEKREEKKSWQSDEDKTKPLTLGEIENFELSMIEVDGVLNVRQEGNVLEVYTDPKKVGSVYKHILEDLKYTVDSFEIIMVPKTPLSVNEDVKEKIKSIIEQLEDLDDVQTVWVNVEI